MKNFWPFYFTFVHSKCKHRARFAGNVEWDFFYDFQTTWIFLLTSLELVTISVNPATLKVSNPIIFHSYDKLKSTFCATTVYTHWKKPLNLLSLSWGAKKKRKSPRVSPLEYWGKNYNCVTLFWWARDLKKKSLFGQLSNVTSTVLRLLLPQQN